MDGGVFIRTTRGEVWERRDTGPVAQPHAVVKEQGSGAADKLLFLLQFFQHICPVSMGYIIRRVSWQLTEFPHVWSESFFSHQHTVGLIRLDKDIHHCISCWNDSQVILNRDKQIKGMGKWMNELFSIQYNVNCSVLVT